MSETENRAKQLADAVRHKLQCVEDTDDPVYRAAYASIAVMLAADLAEQLRYEQGVAAGKALAKQSEGR